MLTAKEKNTLLLLFATGMPINDISGEWGARGLVGNDGMLTEKGRELAREVALADPEVTEEFKREITEGGK